MCPVKQTPRLLTIKNLIEFKEDKNTTDILVCYFIILKFLYCNKNYPFEDTIRIEKYIKLSRNIYLYLLDYK